MLEKDPETRISSKRLLAELIQLEDDENDD